MRSAPILWRVIAEGIQPAIHGTGSCSWTLGTPREERFARIVTRAFEVAKPFAQTCKFFCWLSIKVFTLDRYR